MLMDELFVMLKFANILINFIISQLIAIYPILSGCWSGVIYSLGDGGSVMNLYAIPEESNAAVGRIKRKNIDGLDFNIICLYRHE